MECHWVKNAMKKNKDGVEEVLWEKAVEISRVAVEDA